MGPSGANRVYCTYNLQPDDLVFLPGGGNSWPDLPTQPESNPVIQCLRWHFGSGSTPSYWPGSSDSFIFFLGAMLVQWFRCADNDWCQHHSTVNSAGNSGMGRHLLDMQCVRYKLQSTLTSYHAACEDNMDLTIFINCIYEPPTQQESRPVNNWSRLTSSIPRINGQVQKRHMNFLLPSVCCPTSNCGSFPLVGQELKHSHSHPNQASYS